MRIDPAFRLELIANQAERDILKHVLLDTWLDKPVAVVADGYTMVVVPVEMEATDEPGLLHVSVLSRALELAGIDDELEASDVQVQLRKTRACLSDGSTMPRVVGSIPQQYPNWRKLIPSCIADAEQEPVFGIQPRLLDLTSKALGCRFVALHRSNATQILVAPAPLDGKIQPPFGLMMLTHLAGLP